MEILTSNLDITFMPNPSLKSFEDCYFWWSQGTWVLVCRILITRGVPRKEGLIFQQDTCKTSGAILSRTQMA